jgi:hypothetical protein
LRTVTIAIVCLALSACGQERQREKALFAEIGFGAPVERVGAPFENAGALTWDLAVSKAMDPRMIIYPDGFSSGSFALYDFPLVQRSVITFGDGTSLRDDGKTSCGISISLFDGAAVLKDSGKNLLSVRISCVKSVRK